MGTCGRLGADRHRARQVRAGPPAPWPPIAGALESLGPLEIVLLPAGSSALSREWNELLDQFHYLGAGPLWGAQLRYLVRSGKGPVAAPAFSAAAWAVAGRDRWIGWSAGQRRENLHLVVKNSRRLIPAHVQVPNLASHVLAAGPRPAARRLAAALRLHAGASGDREIVHFWRF